MTVIATVFIKGVLSANFSNNSFNVIAWDGTILMCGTIRTVNKTYHPDHPPNWDETKSWSQEQPYFPFKLLPPPRVLNPCFLKRSGKDIQSGPVNRKWGFPSPAQT